MQHSPENLPHLPGATATCHPTMPRQTEHTMFPACSCIAEINMCCSCLLVQHAFCHAQNCHHHGAAYIRAAVFSCLLPCLPCHAYLCRRFLKATRQNSLTLLSHSSLHTFHTTTPLYRQHVFLVFSSCYLLPVPPDFLTPCLPYAFLCNHTIYKSSEYRVEGFRRAHWDPDEVNTTAARRWRNSAMSAENSGWLQGMCGSGFTDSHARAMLPRTTFCKRVLDLPAPHLPATYHQRNPRWTNVGLPCHCPLPPGRRRCEFFSSPSTCHANACLPTSLPHLHFLQRNARDIFNRLLHDRVGGGLPRMRACCSSTNAVPSIEARLLPSFLRACRAYRRALPYVQMVSPVRAARARMFPFCRIRCCIETPVFARRSRTEVLPRCQRNCVYPFIIVVQNGCLPRGT